MTPLRVRTFVSTATLICRPPIAQATCLKSRFSSAVAASTAHADGALPSSLPARWLSDLKRRIGYCIIFGLKDEQIDEAGSIARVLAKEWRELVAGSEGFLTGKHWAGIEGRAVEWGEMVSVDGEY